MLRNNVAITYPDLGKILLKSIWNKDSNTYEK